MLKVINTFILCVLVFQTGNYWRERRIALCQVEAHTPTWKAESLPT